MNFGRNSNHGAASGSVRAHSLAELREVVPELPTLEEALEFFVDEASETGLHVDLKLTTRVDELAGALVRFGLAERTVASSFHVPSLRETWGDAAWYADPRDDHAWVGERIAAASQVIPLASRRR